MNKRISGKPASIRSPWRRRAIVPGLLAIGVAVAAAVYYWRPTTHVSNRQSSATRTSSPVDIPSSTDVPALVNTSGVDPATLNAIRDARAAVVASPGTGAAWGRLGMILQSHGLSREAEVCLRHAETLEPGEPRWPYLRAMDLMAEDFATSVIELERAARGVDHRTDDAADAIRLRAGEAMLEQGRLNDAGRLFNGVLRAGGTSPRTDFGPMAARALLDLGRAALAADHPAEARDLLTRSLKAQPNIQATHALRAEVYRRLGDQPAADADRLAAANLHKNPAWPDPILSELGSMQGGETASLNRADALLAENRLPEAIDLFRQVTREHPNSMRAWLDLGHARRLNKDLAQAEAALRSGIQHAPDSMNLQMELGDVLLLEDRFADAAELCRAVIRLQPDLAEGHFALGACLQRLEDQPAAVNEFRESLRCEPGLVAARIALADSLWRIDQTPEAIEQLQLVLKLAPNDSRAAGLLARLQLPASHP